MVPIHEVSERLRSRSDERKSEKVGVAVGSSAATWSVRHRSQQDPGYAAVLDLCLSSLVIS